MESTFECNNQIHVHATIEVLRRSVADVIERRDDVRNRSARETENRTTRERKESILVAMFAPFLALCSVLNRRILDDSFCCCCCCC